MATGPAFFSHYTLGQGWQNYCLRAKHSQQPVFVPLFFFFVPPPGGAGVRCPAWSPAGRLQGRIVTAQVPTAPSAPGRLVNQGRGIHLRSCGWCRGLPAIGGPCATPVVAVEAVGGCQLPLGREKTRLHSPGAPGGGSGKVGPALCRLPPRPPHPCTKGRAGNAWVWVGGACPVQVTI